MMDTDRYEDLILNAWGLMKTSPDFTLTCVVAMAATIPLILGVIGRARALRSDARFDATLWDRVLTLLAQKRAEEAGALAGAEEGVFPALYRTAAAMSRGVRQGCLDALTAQQLEEEHRLHHGAASFVGTAIVSTVAGLAATAALVTGTALGNPAAAPTATVVLSSGGPAAAGLLGAAAALLAYAFFAWRLRAVSARMSACRYRLLAVLFEKEEPKGPAEPLKRAEPVPAAREEKVLVGAGAGSTPSPGSVWDQYIHL